MKRVLLFILFYLISTIIFAFNYDEEVIKARKFSWDKNWAEAEKIYINLIKEHKTSEVILDYSNMLAWSGRISEAISLLESEKENYKNEIEFSLRLAKFYFWNKSYNKANDLYLFLKNQKIDTGKEGDDFLKFYNNYKKFEFKLNGNTQLARNYEFISYKREMNGSFDFIYHNYDLFTIVVSGENIFKDFDLTGVSNKIDFYAGNLFLSAGLSNTMLFYIETAYTLNPLTLGTKFSWYNGSEAVNISNIFVYYLYPVLDLYFLDFVLTNKANFIISQKNYSTGLIEIAYDYNFMTKLTWNDLSYTHYYDFNSVNMLNLGILNTKIVLFDIFSISPSASYDFSKNLFNAGLSLGIKF